MIAHRRPGRDRARTPADRREQGLSLLMVALLITPLLIVTALVADIGVAKQRKRQIQSGADAAALAAAQELDGTSSQFTRAVAVAKTWAAKNVDGLTANDWIGCTDGAALTYRPESGNTCISFDSASAPTRVRVRIPVEDQPQFFGRIVRSGALQVSASAVARKAPTVTASAGDCGLCARDKMQLAGTQNIRILGGGTIHTREMFANWDRSTSTIQPCPVKAVTGNQANTRCPPNTSTNPITYVPAAPVDPFASVPDPPTGIQSCSVKYNNGQPCNINNAADVARFLKPDTLMTQGFKISNVTLNLESNRSYYFMDRFEIGDNVTVTGTGVTLFFVCGNGATGVSRGCNPGERGGSFETTGNNVSFNISAPTSGPYAGMAIYFHRNNTQGTAPKFTGSGRYTIDGSIYAYSGRITNAGSRVLDVTGRIFAEYWEDNGNQSQTIVRFDGGTTSSGGSAGGISLDG